MQPWELAQQYIGVPFQHMGRSVRGLDCVGLLLLIAWTRGWRVEDLPYYGREPASNNNSFDLRDHLRRYLGDPVDRPLQPNDIPLMKLRPRFDPAHVGIITPHPYGLGIIHSNGQLGRVTLQRIDQQRMDQIVEVYQWPVKH